MKSLKKVGVLTLVLALVLTFTACGGSSSSEADKTIKVGATPAPHAEILNEVKDVLAKDGWTLEVTEFEDYVQPNEAVNSGELDANYFQHQPYLDEYNTENKTELVSAGAIHYEPLGVYKGTKKSFDELEKGDKIGVPNDASNEARALQLLAENGVIELQKEAGLEATKESITKNDLELEIVELEAATLPNSLPDLALGVINGNYAIGAKLTSKDSIAFEGKDSAAAETFANIICCAKGNEESEKVQALVNALKTDAVKKFIDEKYDGAVKTVF